VMALSRIVGISHYPESNSVCAVASDDVGIQCGVQAFWRAVGMSSIGMFGPAGGWGIPIAPPTLMITVGGTATKPRYVDDSLQPPEILDVTISLDHLLD
jgi:hypothetical protein